MSNYYYAVTTKSPPPSPPSSAESNKSNKCKNKQLTQEEIVVWEEDDGSTFQQLFQTPGRHTQDDGVEGKSAANTKRTRTLEEVEAEVNDIYDQLGEDDDKSKDKKQKQRSVLPRVRPPRQPRINMKRRLGEAPTTTGGVFSPGASIAQAVYERRRRRRRAAGERQSDFGDSLQDLLRTPSPTDDGKKTANDPSSCQEPCAKEGVTFESKVHSMGSTSNVLALKIAEPLEKNGFEEIMREIRNKDKLQDNNDQKIRPICTINATSQKEQQHHGGNHQQRKSKTSKPNLKNERQHNPYLSRVSTSAKVKKPSAITTTTQSSTKYDEKKAIASPPDPYGDVFGDDAFVMMDALVAQNAKNSSANASTVDPMEQRQHAPQQKHDDKGKESSDPFGHLPEIDFDAMDECILSTRSSSSLGCQACEDGEDNHRRFSSFTRYTVCQVDIDARSFTKCLKVREFDAGDKGRISDVLLKGEWFHSEVAKQDTIHLVSIYSYKRTDIAALPTTLDTNPTTTSETDDLIIIVDPDELITPTTISEAVDCPRRAVLKKRIGSSGLTRAAILGTMRHDLFESCLQSKDTSYSAAQVFAKKIARKNATNLVGCNVDEDDAVNELMQTLPQIQEFCNSYFKFDKRASSGSAIKGICEQTNTSIWLEASDVYATEEGCVVPEMGMKGNIDATLAVSTWNVGENNNNWQRSVGPVGDPLNAIMPLELKTGHNQNFQFSHGAQLSLYILMMKVRYGSALVNPPIATENRSLGAASGGVLLYLNHKGLSPMHLSPTMPEMRSLMGHRNTVATYVKRASEVRGVIVHTATKEKSERNNKIEILPATPAKMPDCIGQSYQCYRCYSNKECSLYARSEMSFPNNPNTYHPDVVGQLTGHLNDADVQYFMEWDRMIDLEAKEANQNITQHWLKPAAERERQTGLCISSLEWDSKFVDSTPRNDARTTLRFFRTNTMSMTAGSQMSSHNHSGLSTLKIESGHHIVVGTDGCMYSSENKLRPRFRRHKMHIVRGTVTAVSEHSICVLTSIGESLHLKEIVTTWAQNNPPIDDIGRHITALHENVCYFRMDKDEIMSGTGTLRQNLIKLFTADVPAASPNNISQKDRTNDVPLYLKQRLSRLRNLIVNLDLPVFNPNLAGSMFTADEGCIPNLSVKGCNLDDLFFEYSCNLNTDQQAAVTKIVTALDYTVVQGMPGTGKTSMISFVARLLAARGKRILITSYTHAAVDNLLMKLMDAGVNEDGSLLRIGPKSACHPSVHCILASSLALEADNGSGTNDGLPSAKSLKQVTSNARIVGVTALSATRSPLLLGQHFDVVICDEAGQLTQPASLGALMSADTFVLVGDHMQLPPLVVSDAADQAGYGISMMKRLADAFPSSVAQLTLQYRMHGDIVDICNEIVYKGKLKCANESIRTDLLKLEKYPVNLPQPRRRPLAPVVADTAKKTHWLASVIDPSKPVVFVDTDNIRKLNDRSSNQNQSKSVGAFTGLERSLNRRGTGGNVVNEVEVALVKHSVNALLSCGLKPNEVGVICPLRSQIRLLDEDIYLSEMKKNGLEVSTIDRYQGRDKHAIIISFVRSNEGGNAGRLLQDRRRINVAVSRAKRKLIMIGSVGTLKKGSQVLSSMLELVRRRGWIEGLPLNAHQVYDII